MEYLDYAPNDLDFIKYATKLCDMNLFVVELTSVQAGKILSKRNNEQFQDDFIEIKPKNEKVCLKILTDGHNDSIKLCKYEFNL